MGSLSTLEETIQAGAAELSANMIAAANDSLDLEIETRVVERSTGRSITLETTLSLDLDIDTRTSAHAVDGAVVRVHFAAVHEAIRLRTERMTALLALPRILL